MLALRAAAAHRADGRRLRPGAGVDHGVAGRPGVGADHRRGQAAQRATTRARSCSTPCRSATRCRSRATNATTYVGSQAVFSDLTFAELPQLANMNRDAAGVDISLRRAGDLVILEGRADLTSLNDPDADVSLSVSFPGEVTSTNGDQVSSDSRRVEAQARCGEHHERAGPLHRPQRTVVHRRGDLAGHRRVPGRGSPRRAGVDEPRPLAARDLKPDLSQPPTNSGPDLLQTVIAGSTLNALRGMTKGAPAERGHSGTVGRRVGGRRHRSTAGVSPRASDATPRTSAPTTPS